VGSWAECPNSRQLRSGCSDKLKFVGHEQIQFRTCTLFWNLAKAGSPITHTSVERGDSYARTERGGGGTAFS
jgi:hypothetical protein